MEVSLGQPGPSRIFFLSFRLRAGGLIMRVQRAFTTCFSRYLNDLYVLDLRFGSNNLIWEVPTLYGSPPPPRESHTASFYDPGGKPQLIIYGGTVVRAVARNGGGKL